ncbi:MAG: hypothetical protein MHPSP_004230, partial [Paramarteilia canceri]
VPNSTHTSGKSGLKVDPNTANSCSFAEDQHFLYSILNDRCITFPYYICYNSIIVNSHEIKIKLEETIKLLSGRAYFWGEQNPEYSRIQAVKRIRKLREECPKFKSHAAEEYDFLKEKLLNIDQNN